jgi:hypothetical protein
MCVSLSSKGSQKAPVILLKRYNNNSVRRAALRAAHDLAIKAMRPVHGSATLVNVNDVRGHAAVLALFDEVIAAG